jgi:membrane-bound lytic murein transglycosylase MltF
MKSLETTIVLLAISLLIGACARKEESAAPVPAPASVPAAASAEVHVGGTAETPAAEPTPAPAPDDGQLTIALEQTMKPWTGDLDGMIERRVVRILTVFSKTFYFIDKGVQRGSSYDMGRLFVEDLNKKLAKDRKLKNKNLKMHAVFIPVSRGELIPSLVAGKGDIVIASFGVTAERQKLVDFSSPLVANVSEVVVSGPGSPAISSVDDLAGKQVFVRRSSTYYESLAALNRRFAAEKKPAVIIKEAPETLEDEDLIEMANAGLVPFIVVADFYADFWKEVFPAITVHKDIALRTGGNIAWAIRKGSPQLKAAVDDFAVRNGKGTSIGNQLMAKYLKDVKYVKDATTESERRKLQALVEYFRKYGDQYDVDWVLMAAQGYQESQLNQTVRSPVGAIGVMQVMPATGKDLDVGDISQAEANIHAGIKYMRWMIDNYYGKEPMTNLDKALFAFASYNAGAGRIAGLRKEAARRGLDPNVWFHNVEYVAADQIGAETVTYVANIYKYYIAYQLMLEARAEKEKAVQQMKGQNKEVR